MRKVNERKVSLNILKKQGIHLFMCMLTLLAFTNCDKDDNLTSIGMLTYEGKSYAVTIGNIEKDTDGYTTIELRGDLEDYTVIKQGKISPLFCMEIVVDKKTLQMEYCYISKEVYEYTFLTKKNPETITVYTVDGKSTVTFDGKKKTVKKENRAIKR